MTNKRANLPRSLEPTPTHYDYDASNTAGEYYDGYPGTGTRGLSVEDYEALPGADDPDGRPNVKRLFIPVFVEPVAAETPATLEAAPEPAPTTEEG